VDIRETSTTRALDDVYLLRLNTFQDSAATLQGRIATRHQATLFPDAARGEFQLGYENSRALTNQASGLERQYSESFRINALLRMKNDLQLAFPVIWEASNAESVFEARNFSINTSRIEPSVSWRPFTSLQTQTSVGYAGRKERLSGSDATVLTIREQLAYQSRGGLQLTGTFTARRATVIGVPSANAIFELTEGAGVGNSLQWAVQAALRINSLLRASGSYDGRTIPSGPAVHTVRIVISAIF
jgi:hypothetical protein